VVYIFVPIQSLIHIFLTTKPGVCYVFVTQEWTDIAVTLCTQEVQISNFVRIPGYVNRNAGDFLQGFKSKILLNYQKTDLGKFLIYFLRII